MRDKEENLEAYKYESCLNLAFQYNKRISPAHKQEFLNLIDAERGEKQSFLPSADKQLQEIKKRLKQAIEIFQKQKLPKEKKDELLIQIPIIDNAYSSNDISKVVTTVLQCTETLFS